MADQNLPIKKIEKKEVEVVPSSPDKEVKKIEKIVIPEAEIKFRREIVEKEIETEIAGRTEEKIGGIIATSQTSQIFREREKKIEQILEDGLKDIYMQMPPKNQKEFKLAGEETAKKINKLLAKTKIKANKIVNLIKKWLSLIPGVNKFFLEQEAKIKTDTIMRINDEMK